MGETTLIHTAPTIFAAIMKMNVYVWRNHNHLLISEKTRASKKERIL